MNQKQYTWSLKDRKFLVAILFLQFSFIFMAISFFGLYYKSQSEDCKRLAKRLELGDWAKGELDKAQDEFKLESIKKNYESKGISAEEY